MSVLLDRWWSILLHTIMQGGFNALHLCTKGGHLDVAKYLAPKMEDHLHDTDDEGDTALHWAVRMGKLHLVEYLVGSYGFDVTERGKVGPAAVTC